MIAADFLSAVTPRAAPGTMSDTASKPIAIPRAVERRDWRTSGPEAEEPRVKPELQVTHRQQDAVVRTRKPASRLAEDIELGMAEIQRIMQGENHSQSQAKALQCFCGVSPPTRATGAANPLGLDTAWRHTAYKACTHSNLQALREMSESALHRNVYGDVLSIPDSPNLGFLSADFDGFENLDDRRTSPASDQTNY
ncbi:hypothetical protein ABBQ38_012779 [Trebouxia sp. C0009 RCD-2024]